MGAWPTIHRHSREEVGCLILRGIHMAKKESKPKLFQGSLDLLILKTLTSGSMHGYSITRHLFETSNEFINVEEGSLYPALHRMARKGWIESSWGTSDSNRRAKFYALTSKGKKQLKVEQAAWVNMNSAISQILNHGLAKG